jgi:hypothetical protein
VRTTNLSAARSPAATSAEPSRSRRLAGLVLALASVVPSGCATIFTGTKDSLTFHANVPEVRLTIDGQYMGELPLRIDMSRNFVGGRQFVARFEREGYVVQEFQLQREFNPVAILDVTSIPTSGGVDVLTGSLMKFSPTDYHVQMLAEGASARASAFRDAAAFYAFALVNHRNVQKDLVRGGGEHLSSLAEARCASHTELIPLVENEALRNARSLVDAPGPHEFIERFERALAEGAVLRGSPL